MKSSQDVQFQLQLKAFQLRPGEGGTPLYGLYRYVQSQAHKGYTFSALLVINRVSILADFGIHLQVPESFVFWVTWD